VVVVAEEAVATAKAADATAGNFLVTLSNQNRGNRSGCPLFFAQPSSSVSFVPIQRWGRFGVDLITSHKREGRFSYSDASGSSLCAGVSLSSGSVIVSRDVTTGQPKSK
jgi:hypothetical protein